MINTAVYKQLNGMIVWLRHDKHGDDMTGIKPPPWDVNSLA